MSQKKRKKKTRAGNPVNYSKIKSGLRRLWLYYDIERKIAIDKATITHGSWKGWKQCSHCLGLFKTLKEVEVHHIHPVCPKGQKFKSWGYLTKRLFCKAKNLELLCKNCHEKEKELE